MLIINSVIICNGECKNIPFLWTIFLNSKHEKRASQNRKSNASGKEASQVMSQKNQGCYGNTKKV